MYTHPFLSIYTHTPARHPTRNGWWCFQRRRESFSFIASMDKGNPEATAPKRRDYFGVDVCLRVFLFATTLTALVVMSTAKQTKLTPVPQFPGVVVPIEAKFTNSPAFIYFVAAVAVACLYSIITTLTSLGLIAKPTSATKFLFHYALCDVVMLGLVAAATGTAGGVAYIGLKGNSHTGWTKICNVYDTFCKHVGSAIAMSLVSSIVLILLIMLSLCSLYSRTHRA